MKSCNNYVASVAIVITKSTAPDIPTEVETLLDTPKNGHIPKNWDSTILLTKTAAISMMRYSIFMLFSLLFC